MKQLDLTQYGIVGTTEIVHNPSFFCLIAVRGNDNRDSLLSHRRV